MRELAVLILAVLAAGACGRGAEKPPPAPKVDRAAARTAVLAASDVGESWTAVDNPTPNTVQIGGSVGAANITPSLVRSTSAFESDEGDGFVSNSVFLLRNQTMSRAVIAAHDDAAKKRRWVQDRDDGGTAEFKNAGKITDIPQLGDEMFTARLNVKVTNADNDTFDQEVEYVAYRAGPLVGIVVAQDADAGVFARRQEAKVARLLT